MACQIPNECLDEILECLEKDEPTLYSCLLVNRLWCKIAVRILWRNIWDFKSSYQQRSLSVASSILSTLIACLSSESKEHLFKNKIYISTPTSKPPLFNYAEFCKVLSINEIAIVVDNALRIKASINPLDLRNSLVANEVIKMLTSQISSLKKFTCCYISYFRCNHIDISFPHVLWTKDLSEFCCSSNLPSSLFYQLSQICHNLQSISISFADVEVSNELKELISSQNNLKILTLSAYNGCNWACIIPTIVKHSHTITKLQLYGDDDDLPFSFVSSFTNLQELIFSFEYGVGFEDFKKLQYVNFSKLEILKIPYKCPKSEYVVNFLRNNGSNLKKFYVGEMNASLNLSIANFCPNIRSFLIRLNKGGMAILRVIFDCCKYLESIIIQCGYDLNENEVLDTIVNYSPNNFYELKMHIRSNICASPEDWESFFISWKNRIPKRLLHLVFLNNTTINKENFEIIEKYENLGIIKFYNKRYEEEEKEEELSHYC